MLFQWIKLIIVVWVWIEPTFAFLTWTFWRELYFRMPHTISIDIQYPKRVCISPKMFRKIVIRFSFKHTNPPKVFQKWQFPEHSRRKKMQIQNDVCFIFQQMILKSIRFMKWQSLKFISYKSDTRLQLKALSFTYILLGFSFQHCKWISCNRFQFENFVLALFVKRSIFICNTRCSSNIVGIAYARTSQQKNHMRLIDK